MIFTAISLVALLFAETSAPPPGAGGKMDRYPPIPRSIIATTPKRAGAREIKLAALVNYGGSISMGPLCTEGIRIALDAVENASLLSKYQITVEPFNDECDVAVGMQNLFRILNSSETSNFAPLIVGPTCGTGRYSGRFLKHFGFVSLSVATINEEIFADRRQFSHHFILTPSLETFYEAIPAFLATNGWFKVGLLSETFPCFVQYEQTLAYNLQKLNISLLGTAKVTMTSGQTFPLPEHFDSAVQEVATMNTNILVVNTHFGGFLACYLYKYGIYGPSRVILFFGPAYFKQNSFLRSPGCTDEMLAEVLKSVIFFVPGSPNNLDRNVVDVLGTSGKDYDNKLMERIKQPQLEDGWLLMRSMCYSSIVAAALVLNKTEAKLKENNDSLSNWLTNGSRFRAKSIVVQSIIRENVEKLQYKGLDTYEQDGVNSHHGATAFIPALGADQVINPSAIQSAVVAVYESSTAEITSWAYRYHWRTMDGKTPRDSLQVIQVHEPLVDVTSKILTTCFTSVLLALNVLTLVLNFVKRERPVIANSFPLINSAAVVGCIFMLIFVLLLVGSGEVASVGHCIGTSLLVVFGFSLTSCSILVKMHLAEMVAPRERSSSITARIFRRKSHISQIRPRTSSITARPLRPESRMVAPSQANLPMIPVDSKKQLMAFLFSLAYSILQFILVAIWMGMAPPTVVRHNRELEFSGYDETIAYQHYPFSCHLDICTSPIAKGFLIMMSFSYIIVVLRSLYLAYALRKWNIPELISDVHLVRMASYAVNITAIVGGAIIWLLFGNDAASLEIAVSVLILIINTSITVTIFAPKLCQAGYFKKQ